MRAKQCGTEASPGDALLAAPITVPTVSHNERIIRLKTVLARTGLSRSTLYRKMADGTFPRQVPISVHGAGWHESAVNRWIANPAVWRTEHARSEVQ
jgi:prophage regulatory protein